MQLAFGLNHLLCDACNQEITSIPARLVAHCEICSCAYSDSQVHEHHYCDVGAAATRSICTTVQHIALKAATFAADEQLTDDVSIYATDADVEATDPAGKGKKKQKRACDESGIASWSLQVAHVLAECLCIFDMLFCIHRKRQVSQYCSLQMLSNQLLVLWLLNGCSISS